MRSSANDCVLCEEIAAHDTPIAYADEHVVVFPARFPPIGHAGSVLVASRRHVRSLYDVDDALAAVLLTRVRDVAIAVRRAFEASETTIRQNNGPPGQEVAHLHFHIAPRYLDDGYWNAGTCQLTDHERSALAAQLRDDLATS